MSKISSFWSFNKPLILHSLKLSYPIMLGQFGIVVMGVVDVMMLGYYSTTHQAAAAVSNGVFFLVVVFGMGCLFSISALVSNAVGEKNDNAIFPLFQKGLKAAFILAGLSILIMFLIKDYFYLLGQDIKVVPYAKDYLNIVTWSVLPMFIFIAARQLTDGLGNTLPAMFITLAAIPINAFCNYLMIFGNFGFPELGAEGAAYASFFTRSIMAAAILIFVYKSSKVNNYRQRTQKGEVKLIMIFLMGIPIGLQFLWEVGLFAIAKIFAGNLGEIELASHEIALSLASMTFMVASGLSAGGSIMVGNANGQNDPNMMRRVGHIHYFMISIFMLFCALAFMIGNNFFASLFSLDQEVVNLAANLLFFVSAFQLFDGIATISMGLLRGAKDVKYPSRVAFIFYVLFGITCCYVLAFHTSLGIYGIWVGLTLPLIGSSGVLMRRFYKILKKR